MHPIIGIDFGTCNTVISYKNKSGKIRSLRYNGADVVPSVITFKSKSKYVIGREAVKYSGAFPEATVQHFKTKLHDNRFLYTIKAIDGSEFRLKPRAVAERFLSMIIEGISDRLMKDFDSTDIHAVITVPAKFNSTEKEITRRAALNANISEVRLAPEPTAAAIACQAEIEDESIDMKSVLVYDFGGGTFDVAIIQKKHGIYESIATGGDKELGGNTLTNLLMRNIMNDISSEFGVEFPYEEDELDTEEMSEDDYKINRLAVWNEAESLKRDLSTEEEVEISLPLIFGNRSEIFSAIYTRSDFENIIQDKIFRTIEITKSVLKEAKDSGLDKLDYIVLAGGSSYIPLISKLIEKELPEENLYAGGDFSQLISTGAAILAQNIGIIDNLTQNITSVQMGVKTTNGTIYNKFEMLIPENSSLPYSNSKEYQLSKDGQTKFEIAYFEYDIKNYPNSIRVDDDGMEEVDTLIINNLPANLKKDEVRIKITFCAQTDGSLDIGVEILDVNDRIISTGKLEVKKGSDFD